MAKPAHPKRMKKTQIAKKKIANKKAANKSAAKKKVATNKPVRKSAMTNQVTAAAVSVPEASDDTKEGTKQAALKAIDVKLEAAGTMKNKCRTPDCDVMMDACIARLGAQSTAIYDQAYVAADDDPDFAKAIAAIKQATKEMNDVAPNMASATAFVSSLAGFFTAAGKVVPALRGPA
jgi:hypothetical protein